MDCTTYNLQYTSMTQTGKYFRKKKVTFQEPPEVAIPMLPLNELNVETIPKQ